MRLTDPKVAASFNSEAMATAAAYSREYHGQTVVIKIGGEVIDNENPGILDEVLQQAIFLKMLGCNVMIVHGGGKQIDQAMKQANVETRKENGIRVADEETLNISRQVGRDIRGRISERITELGRQSKISGFELDGTKVVTAHRMWEGYRTGTFDMEADSQSGNYYHLQQYANTSVDTALLDSVLKSSKLIPVIDWHAASDDGYALTVNADDMAGILAIATKAKRLMFFSTDKEGKIRGVHDQDGQLISELSPQEAQELIDSGVAQGGMVPKLKTCVAAVSSGVEGVVILNPGVPGSIMGELIYSREGTGTLFTGPKKHASGSEYKPKVLGA